MKEKVFLVKKKSLLVKKNFKFLFMLWEAKGAILIFSDFDSLGGLLTGFDGFSLVPEPSG